MSLLILDINREILVLSSQNVGNIVEKWLKS